MDALVKLKEILKDLPEGKVPEDKEKLVIGLLSCCWHLFDGCDFAKMHGGKVDRAENLTFEPPNLLHFIIERHGAASLGSVYAELQGWAVDLDKMEAECWDTEKKRMIRDRDKPLKVEPLADSIVKDIVNGNTASEHLKWKGEKKVQVLVSKLIPETVKETTAKRRKRFRLAVIERLEAQGWKTTKAYNIYEKIEEENN